ncbi:hypothetical protein [Tunturiibacter lichenicola]|uniref:hypothetical protein n=1 Tax=Tunturiibacter lichenicola TaxID=2051959 RepID=UPI003D9AD8D7
MEPDHYRFGGGSSATVLHPLVAVAMVLAIFLILWAPLKNALASLLLAIFLIPKGQVLVLAGVHLNVYRIILLAGLARWVISKRKAPLTGGFNSIDRLFAAGAIAFFVIFSLQYMATQALIKALGDLLDALAGYFVLRFFIRDRDTVRETIRVMAIVAFIAGICMLNEQRTGVNVFGLLGGTLSISETRNGAIRSMGPFLHSIPAGAFGATLVPLLIWLWSEKTFRKTAILGFLGATVMAITCHSSTVLGCYVAGIFGLCMWPLRKQMRLIRYGLLLSVIVLHLVMKGPVWSLLEHIDLTGSSENFHRYQLVDTFIRHFDEWWLLGTQNNGSWGWEMADTSNEYVTYGIGGGLLSFVLFIAIISKCLGRIGTKRKLVSGNRSEEWFFWCLGSAMLSHLVVFIGIDYFDQMLLAWFALLVMISTSVSTATPNGKAKPVRRLKNLKRWYFDHELDEEFQEPKLLNVL